MLRTGTGYSMTTVIRRTSPSGRVFLISDVKTSLAYLVVLGGEEPKELMKIVKNGSVVVILDIMNKICDLQINTCLPGPPSSLRQVLDILAENSEKKGRKELIRYDKWWSTVAWDQDGKTPSAGNLMHHDPLYHRLVYRRGPVQAHLRNTDLRLDFSLHEYWEDNRQSHDHGNHEPPCLSSNIGKSLAAINGWLECPPCFMNAFNEFDRKVPQVKKIMEYLVCVVNEGICQTGNLEKALEMLLTCPIQEEGIQGEGVSQMAIYEIPKKIISSSHKTVTLVFKDDHRTATVTITNQSTQKAEVKFLGVNTAIHVSPNRFALSGNESKEVTISTKIVDSKKLASMSKIRVQFALSGKFKNGPCINLQF